MRCKTLAVALLTVILSTTARGADSVVLRPLPGSVQGVSSPAISLNGTWKFKFTPKSKATTIEVPGEAAMQGFAIEHDKPVEYFREFSLPADYAGKSVILRFDGVYSHAKLWVNGKYVREHHGGFTRWESDITDLVKPGRRNEIRLEVTDRLDEISYGSGYAHHPIGGILRDVTVYALPKNHISNFYADTHLDSLYRDATLCLGYDAPQGATLKVSLSDPSGAEVLSSTVTTSGQKLPVVNPIKWDAEHPNLYTLNVEVMNGDKPGYRFSRKIGFRDVKIVGNRMLVNGQNVKLRGACRHDVHPTLGRTTTPMLDSLDAVIFKQANMNFVRTSHYPPTERFLEYCDSVGLYVECETAVCFVNTHRQKNYAPAATQDDPAYTDRYMGQLQEMIHSMRHHSSVLFWSVGNECQWGSNFQKSYDWVKGEDTTRPVIFSYPGMVPKDQNCYDILSMHYPGVEGNMNQYGATVSGFQTATHPSIYDEWAHVPCYTYTTLQDDPNIREFWGISLDMMWSKLFDAPGGLGGAIWGFLDETFMLPTPKVGTAYWTEFAKTAKPADFQGKNVGYGEWGIIDVWRRQKPEFWGTKKAYSPIRLLQTAIPESEFTTGERLILPIYNRFDHTNLNEVAVRYKYRGREVAVPSPSIAPHQRGLLIVPADRWGAGESLDIEFLTASGDLIDAYTVKLGERTRATADAAPKAALSIARGAEFTTVSGEGFAVPFNMSTGLIENATSNGQVVIERGPMLNLDLNVSHKTGPEVREKAGNYIVADSMWRKTKLAFIPHDNRVRVELSGTYNSIEIDIIMNINPDGSIEMNYLSKNEPNGWLREAGLRFDIPASISTLSWNRKGYWSYYPEGDFAGNSGSAPLYNSHAVAYGQDPAQAWGMDTHNYYYFADRGAICNNPLTNIAKGMKENVYDYSLRPAEGNGALSITSPTADVACRMNKLADDKLVLYVNNRWDYPEIAWGDYCKSLDVSPLYGKITINIAPTKK